MRLHPPASRTFAGTAVLVVFLLGLLLLGGVPPSAHAPGPSSTPQSATHSHPESTDATPLPGSSGAERAAPIGEVVASPLLNFNTTIPGNFDSTVLDWSVGPGTLDSASGQIWLSDNLTQVFHGPEPAGAPAVVYDPSTNAFVRTVPALANTTDLLYDAGNGLIYSTDPSNGTVGVFDPTTGAWQGTFTVGTDPSDLALDPANDILFVANTGSDNISIVNVSTGTVEPTTIATGSEPESLALDLAHSHLFIACAGSTFLYVANSSTYGISSTIPLTGDAGSVAVSESAATLAVTVPSTGHLTMVDTSNLAVIPATILIGVNSQPIVVAPNDREYVIAATPRAHLVTVNASTATITNASIPVGAGPSFLTTDGSDGLVFSWSSAFRNLTSVNPPHSGCGRWIRLLIRVPTGSSWPTL
jgi:YVTN family beta-propeller protein